MCVYAYMHLYIYIYTYGVASEGVVGSGALSLTRWSLQPSQPFRKRHQGSGNGSIRPLDQANPETGLGWNWSLGKTARFARLKAVPPVILTEVPGWGCKLTERRVYLVGPHTHTCNGGRPAGPSSNQWHSSTLPLWPRSTRTVSAWRVGQ